jgi:hypothetical protein
MRKGYTTVDYVAFSTLGVIAVVAALYTAFGWKALGTFLGDQSTAAWVQAIGSVAAIGVAIWIGERQAQRASQLQREIAAAEVRRRLGVLAGLIDVATKEIRHERASALASPEDWASAFDDAEYEAFVDAANALSINELPSYALVGVLKELRYRLFCCWDNLKDISADAGDSAHVAGLIEYLDLNLDALNDARKIVSAEAVALGVELPASGRHTEPARGHKAVQTVR